jgi:hypothetical protein
MCLRRPLRAALSSLANNLMLTSRRFAAVQVVFVGQVIEKAPQEVAWAAGQATPKCSC